MNGIILSICWLVIGGAILIGALILIAVLLGLFYAISAFKDMEE